MLKTTLYAQQLRDFIYKFADDEGLEIKFKIYIRLDCSLEARLYVKYKAGSKVENSDTLQSEDLEKRLQNGFEAYLGNVSKTLTSEEIPLLKGKRKDLYIPDVDFDIDNYEEAECGLDSYMFVDGNNTVIESGTKYRLNSWLDSLSSRKNSTSNDNGQDTPIITFYSYKGGVGRTTTLIAFALYLAALGKRVAVVDCDLEAPGYLNFFDLSNQKDMREGKRNGLVEYFSDYNFVKGDDKYLDISQYVVIPDENSQGGKGGKYLENIYIVPGGNLNDPLKADQQEELYAQNSNKEFVEGISRLNFSNAKSMVQSFKSLFKKLKEEYKIDVFLLDSRTGINDIFSTLALNLSDHIVGFFGFSDQSMPGLRQVLQVYASLSPQKKLALSIVTNLLPPKANGEWINKGCKKISNVIDYAVRNVCNVERPNHFLLNRVTKLEMLGTGDNNADASLVTLVEDMRDGKDDSAEIIGQMKDLFNEILCKTIEKKSIVSAFSKPENVKLDSPKMMTAIQRQKAILRHIMSQMDKIGLFAESTKIDPSLFFYRKCMADFFLPSKFIILGSKGSGKSMLYKALGTQELGATRHLIFSSSMKINKNLQLSNENDYICLNAISLKREFSFDKLFASLTDKRFLDVFWMVYTWDAILSDKRFITIQEKSPIGNQVINLTEGFAALDKLSQWAQKYDFSFFAAIEKDFNEINRYMQANNKQLLILYDGLDNINPGTWQETVSPLVDFWRDRTQHYSNISPKLFIRTDLFAYIRGTNTLRLTEMSINIDWAIEEVFGFFSKLVLSNEETKEHVWYILRQLGYETHIMTIENSWDKEAGQFLSPMRAVLTPLVEVFFGRQVKESKDPDTWKFFETSLSLANGTISLRPFINLLNKDVLTSAYQDSDSHVQAIIPSKYYASQSNRDKAANGFIEDLMRGGEFTSDINAVKEFLESPDGVQYRYRELEEKEFNSMLSQVLKTKTVNSKTIQELTNQLVAAGIVAQLPRRNKPYKFAPMFYYIWSLKTPDKWEHGIIDKGRTGKFIIRTSSGKRISFKREDIIPQNAYYGMNVEYKEEITGDDHKIIACRIQNRT